MPVSPPDPKTPSKPKPKAKPTPKPTASAPAPTSTKPKTTTTKPATTAPSTTNPKIDPGTLAADYGFALSVFNSNPELKKLFARAVAGTWADDKFVAELRGTTWFKHTSDTARQWAILQGADPSTAKQRMATRTQTMKDEAASLGITLSAKQLADISRNSIMFGWSDQQVRQSMSLDWNYNAKTPTAGLAGQTIDAFRKTASDYMLPVSDTTLGQWTQQVLAGTKTADDFTEYAKMQAKSMFPTLAAEIDKGTTVAQYADPYKQMAAQTLNINPEDINFMDPKWRVALDNVDPTSHQKSPMTLSDWTAKIKQDSQYGYDQTTGARQQAAQLTGQLSQMFGFGS